MTRPDGKPETLGLTVLDEPTAKQSDPTVLDLQLRTLTKQTTVKPAVRRYMYSIICMYMCAYYKIIIVHRNYYILTSGEDQIVAS